MPHAVPIVPKGPAKIEILNHEIEPDSRGANGWCRILVDGEQVLYLRIAPDALPANTSELERVLNYLRPSLFPDHWTEATIAKDPSSDELVLVDKRKPGLPSVKHVWHKTVIDHRELTQVGRLREDVRLVTHPMFDKPVVCKVAPFATWMPYIDAETRAYHWIEGTKIGPKFHGHVKEGTRVIGILIEYIEGERPAEMEDREACRAVLAKLHLKGIKHGDTHKFNFCMRDDGSAVLIDFERAGTGGKEDFDQDMVMLEASLKGSIAYKERHDSLAA